MNESEYHLDTSLDREHFSVISQHGVPGLLEWRMFMRMKKPQNEERNFMRIILLRLQISALVKYGINCFK
jgi:hypothetical protein